MVDLLPRFLPQTHSRDVAGSILVCPPFTQGAFRLGSVSDTRASVEKENAYLAGMPLNTYSLEETPAGISRATSTGTRSGAHS